VTFEPLAFFGDRTPEAGQHPQTEARSLQTTVEFLREVFERRATPPNPPLNLWAAITPPAPLLSI